MRASTNIQLKTRRVLQLSDFRGVDFSSSALSVRQDRASNMRNFINEYGVNKKRNGWNELIKIKDADGNAQRINGIYEYVNGSRREILVHAGQRFYRLVKSDGRYSIVDITLTSTYTPSKVNIAKIKNQRSQAFFSKGKMYLIGCGDFLVYGSWDGGTTYELRRVADNTSTYIPTTTVSIDNDGVSDDVRARLDDVNMLSSRRINQLLGTSETNKTWTLDAGSIDDGSIVNVKLQTIVDDVEVEKFFSNFVGSNMFKLYEKTDTETIEVGTIDFEKGKITFSIATTPPIENRDNIFVTFYHTVEGYADRIANCSFGTLFGVNGNTDRLFLSGNSDYPNADFYSETDDFTYFADLNTATMGSDSVPIRGYGRLSDSTLVIYKAESDREASIFYRTGTYKESYDKDGNLESLRGIFPTSAGSIGEGVVSSYACANFAGDNVILSKNGVFGIVLSDNVTTTERYARERSRSINEKLKKHKDLSEAVAIVYKNRYHLAIDGAVYVADTRYKYTAADDIDGSFNYEWWYWDNCPIRVFANIDNELYFGSEEGQICVFDDKYSDRTYQYSSDGDLSVSYINNQINYNKDIGIDLSEDDKITVYTEGFYACVVENATVNNGHIFLDEESILTVHDGMEVYADKVENKGLSLNKKYFIKDVDSGKCSFMLEDESGEVIENLYSGFNLCKKLSNTDLYLTNVKNESTYSFQVKDNKYGKPLTLCGYGEVTPSVLSVRFSHAKNVIAEWYTPIFDLGTNESSKTLLKMTISTEPEVNGKLSFGYETRKVNKLINARGINVFSFDNFSFENFSFDTAFANSYSVKVNERNFNFIIFRFVSDNDSNLIVNNFTVIYKINKSNIGVK